MDIVKKFEFLYDQDNYPSNEEFEEVFKSINSKIYDLIRTPNNGNVNLEWLEKFPNLKRRALSELRFDELPSNYRVWLGYDGYSYAEAFGERAFETENAGYVIHTSNNSFAGALLWKILELTGAKNIKKYEYSEDQE